MAKTRIAIPSDTAAAIQFRSNRTCCVCRERGRPTQIHHLDEDPSNNDPDNLALLCLLCHEETQVTGGFGRKLDAHQIRAYRDDWFDCIQKSRNTAESISAEGHSVELKRASGVTARSPEIRPWVSLTCGLANGFRSGTTQFGVEGYYLSLRGVARNHGRSPATNVIFRAELGLMGVGRSYEDVMNVFCDRFRQIPDQIAETIFPDASLAVSHELFLPQNDVDRALAAADFKAIFPFVYGCIQYKSEHTEGIRQTRFGYHLCRVRDDGQPMALMQDGPDWLEQTIALVEPSLSAPD